MKTVEHKIVKTYYSLGHLPLSGLINDQISPFKEVGQYYCVIETHTHTLHTNIYHTHMHTRHTHIHTPHKHHTHIHTHIHTIYTHAHTHLHMCTHRATSLNNKKSSNNFEQLVCAEWGIGDTKECKDKYCLCKFTVKQGAQQVSWMFHKCIKYSLVVINWLLNTVMQTL